MICTPIAGAQSEVDGVRIEIDLGTHQFYDHDREIPYWEIEADGRLRPPAFDCRVELPEGVHSATVELELLDEKDNPVDMMKPNGEPAPPWIETVENGGILTPEWQRRRPKFEKGKTILLKIHARLGPVDRGNDTDLFQLRKR